MAMDSRNIRVKAAPGRVARTSPRGDMIPEDRFVTVQRTPYIMRLIEVHNDLIVEPDTARQAAPKVAPAPSAKE